MEPTAFIMKLFTSLWIRSKLLEVIRHRRRIAHCDEKEAEVIGLENREVKIQNIEFVKVIEEPLDLSEIFEWCLFADQGI